jgi:hypothetical protein
LCVIAHFFQENIQYWQSVSDTSVVISHAFNDVIPLTLY